MSSRTRSRASLRDGESTVVPDGSVTTGNSGLPLPSGPRSWSLAIASVVSHPSLSGTDEAFVRRSDAGPDRRRPRS